MARKRALDTVTAARVSFIAVPMGLLLITVAGACDRAPRGESLSKASDARNERPLSDTGTNAALEPLADGSSRVTNESELADALRNDDRPDQSSRDAIADAGLADDGGAPDAVRETATEDAPKAPASLDASAGEDRPLDGSPDGPLAIRPACVLPLGDSITQGSHLQISYRYWLWSSLSTRGVHANFVGSMTENYLGPPPSPTEPFDKDHEGHWGWRADEVLDRLPGWASGYDPGIVLLHLGTNDCWQGQSPSSTVEEIEAIVDVLRQRNPRVAVLIAKVLPMIDAVPNACVEALNSLIPTMAATQNRSDSPVLVVDQNAGFDLSADTYDGVHPNEAGEKKMSARWEAALLPLLRSATSCP